MRAIRRERDNRKGIYSSAGSAGFTLRLDAFGAFVQQQDPQAPQCISARSDGPACLLPARQSPPRRAFPCPSQDGEQRNMVGKLMLGPLGSTAKPRLRFSSTVIIAKTSRPVHIGNACVRGLKGLVVRPAHRRTIYG